MLSVDMMIIFRLDMILRYFIEFFEILIDFSIDFHRTYFILTDFHFPTPGHETFTSPSLGDAPRDCADVGRRH